MCLGIHALRHSCLVTSGKVTDGSSSRPDERICANAHTNTPHTETSCWAATALERMTARMIIIESAGGAGWQPPSLKFECSQLPRSAWRSGCRPQDPPASIIIILVCALQFFHSKMENPLQIFWWAPTAPYIEYQGGLLGPRFQKWAFLYEFRECAPCVKYAANMWFYNWDIFFVPVFSIFGHQIKAEFNLILPEKNQKIKIVEKKCNKGKKWGNVAYSHPQQPNAPATWGMGVGFGNYLLQKDNDGQCTWHCKKGRQS